MTPMECPWCGGAVAQWNGRAVQTIPRHRDAEMFGTCRGANQDVLIEIEFDPDSGDETGRYRVRPVSPVGQWTESFVEDPEWPVVHPRMPIPIRDDTPESAVVWEPDPLPVGEPDPFRTTKSLVADLNDLGNSLSALTPDGAGLVFEAAGRIEAYAAAVDALAGIMSGLSSWHVSSGQG